MNEIAKINHWDGRGNAVMVYDGGEVQLQHAKAGIRMPIEKWVDAAIATLRERERADKADAELARYKRLEAILRDRADADMHEGRQRPNAEMRVLTDWENGE